MRSYTPERTCIGCRRVCPASELVRLIAPEGRVCVAGRGPGRVAGRRGRGAWLHPDCLALALKSGVMERAFRRRVDIEGGAALLAQMHSASGRSSNRQGSP